MTLKAILSLGLIVCSATVIAAQERGAREVTVSEIPGVIAAGAKWQIVWQGTNNADGIVGTADGGL
jgi:hypothetical protein